MLGGEGLEVSLVGPAEPLRTQEAKQPHRVNGHEIGLDVPQGRQREALRTVFLQCLQPPSVAREHRARVLDGSRGRAEEVEPLPMLRPWVRPDDAARCFRLALESEHVGFDVFNVGARDSFSPAPTLEVVSSALGATPALRDAALYERFPRAAAFGAGRAERVLGWRPPGDWPAYVAEIGAEARAEDD